MSSREAGLGETDEPASGRSRRGAARTRGAATHDMIDERDDAERGLEDRGDGSDAQDMDEDELAFEQLLQESLNQSVLPDLPKMPGYHTCWLTTSNGRDTIHFRQRMGYELITIDMIRKIAPGWEGVGLSDTAPTDMVKVNEMVAARIPERRYRRLMLEFHHNRPLEEESKLRGQLNQRKQEAEQLGGAIQEGDGMDRLIQRATPPRDFLR